jgi:DnaJ domain
MKNYFDILGIAPTATREQIQMQYEFLLNLYHPDQFADPRDKMYVKRKCRALTAAYHALLTGDQGITPQAVHQTISPRVDPDLINWGIVQQGTQVSALVKIYPGSQAQTLLLTVVGDAKWLQLERSGRERRAVRP